MAGQLGHTAGATWSSLQHRGCAPANGGDPPPGRRSCHCGGSARGASAARVPTCLPPHSCAAPPACLPAVMANGQKVRAFKMVNLTGGIIVQASQGCPNSAAGCLPAPLLTQHQPSVERRLRPSCLAPHTCRRLTNNACSPRPAGDSRQGRAAIGRCHFHALPAHPGGTACTLHAGAGAAAGAAISGTNRTAVSRSMRHQPAG